jgi:asparagine synthase (glutamine-hydrolysing)
MCGIFGFLGNPDRANSLDLDIPLRALRHRGPDGNGIFRGRTGDLAVAFAHTRLAVIDLSPLANQPMTTADGRFTLTYNGEVYNFRDIRRELELLGHTFVSHSDTEVVLRSYVEWGKECVDRFRGMFAFAVWDARDGSLFLARDRFGIKPLYYTETPDGFAFASEVRALMKSGLAGSTISREGLRSYFTWGSVADPLTLVDGVYSLLPAHRGFVREAKLTLERYWDLPDGATRELSFDEAVEEIRPLLRESVEKELVSDVPLGVFLSGGIDSSAIVAMAAEVSPRPIHTFTVTFDEAGYNEAPYAREVAERFGCVHTEVHLTAERAMRDLDLAMASYDQPSADGLNTWFVARAAREAGLTVALSGLGGDEIFAGYANFRKFGGLLRAGRMARGVGALAAPLFGGGSLNGTTMRTKKLGEVLRGGGDPARTYAALRCMFVPRQVERLVRELEGVEISELAPRPALAPPPRTRRDDPVSLYSFFELTHYIRNTLLRDSDQMSMAHSLEVRVPLLDHVVAEKVVALTAANKLPATVSTNKALLVRATGSLPPVVTDREKKGFVVPFEEWLAGRESRTHFSAAASQIHPSRRIGLPAIEAWLNASLMQGARSVGV